MTKKEKQCQPHAMLFDLILFSESLLPSSLGGGLRMKKTRNVSAVSLSPNFYEAVKADVGIHALHGDGDGALQAIFVTQIHSFCFGH